MVIKWMTKLTLQYGGEMIDFSVSGAGSIGYSYKKKKNLDFQLITYAKINAKCIIDFKVKVKNPEHFQTKTQRSVFLTLGKVNRHRKH